MQNFSELDTAIYFANMSCLALFTAKDRGKDRENIDKKGNGWKKERLAAIVYLIDVQCGWGF